MANTVVGAASVEITIDLSKFATAAKTQITEALSSASMRDAVTAGLDQAAMNAGLSGQNAASKFAGGINDGASKFSEAGAKAGQSVTDGVSSGLDGASSVFASAGSQGGEAFTEAVASSAAGASDALTGGAEVSDAEISALYDSLGEDAGSSFSDAAAAAIDAGAPDVADAAGNQGELADDAASQSMSEAGAASGDSFIDAGKESLAEMATELSPVTTAEAAKVGTEAGEKMAVAGAEAGNKFTEGATEGIKGLAASLGPIVGVLGAGELVKSSLEAADQLEGANIKIENVFGSSGDAVKTWASSVADSLRLPTVTAEQEAGQFGAYLSGLGVGKDQAAGLSEQLVGLAANMAAFNNADPAEVQAALTSALRGRTTALKQYGVTLTTAQINQEALAHASELGTVAMQDGVPVLDTQQKALATLYAVMDATKNQQGALADTSDTVKAKTQVATAEFANMRAELGTALMPVLASLLGFINTDLIPGLVATGHWISQNREWLEPLVATIGLAVAGYKAWTIATNLWTKATEAAKAISMAFASEQKLATIANEAYNVALAAGKTETEAATAAQVALDAAMDANPIGLVVLAIAALAVGIYEAWQHSATFRDIVKDTFTVIKDVVLGAWNDALKPVINWVIDHWHLLILALPALLGPIGLIILAVVELATHWHTVMNALEDAWNTVGKPVFDVIKDVVAVWVDVIKVLIYLVVVEWMLIWDAIKLVWTTFGQPLFDLIAAAISLWWNDFVKPIFGFFVDAFSLLWSTLQTAWNTLGVPIFDAVEAAARTLGDGIKWAYDNVIKPTVDLIGQAWKDIKSGWDSLLSGLGKIGDDVLGPIRGAINDVIGIINDMLHALNKLSVVLPKVNIPGLGSVGGETIGFNIPDIPTLAAGATILPTAGGTLVRAAEAGKAETVVDTGQTNHLIAALNKRLDNAPATQFGRPVEIHEHVYAQPGQDAASVAADTSRRVARAIRMAA